MRPAFYISPEGKVMYIAECPEEPTLCAKLHNTEGVELLTVSCSILGCVCLVMQEIYKRDLQAAKDSAIEFSDRDQALNIVSTLLPSEVLPLDKIIPIPDQYEVEVRESWGPWHEWTSPEKRAFITPSKEHRKEEVLEGKESQDYKAERQHFIDSYANRREHMNMTDSLGEMFDMYVVPLGGRIAELEKENSGLKKRLKELGGVSPF